MYIQYKSNEIALDTQIFILNFVVEKMSLKTFDITNYNEKPESLLSSLEIK
jgi:hypothetical protein